MTRLRRQWFAKRKSVVALLRETIFQQESPLVDSDAANQAADADAALQELGSDAVAFGYVTMTVVVCDPDPDAVEEQCKAVEQVVQGRGFVAVSETLNAVRSEEHTSELQSLMRISYAVFCLKHKKNKSPS